MFTSETIEMGCFKSGRTLPSLFAWREGDEGSKKTPQICQIFSLSQCFSLSGCTFWETGGTVKEWFCKKRKIREALLSIYWEKTRLLKITDIKHYSVDLHCPLPQCYTATWPGAHLSCLSAHHLCLKMQL